MRLRGLGMRLGLSLSCDLHLVMTSRHESEVVHIGGLG